MLNIAKTIYAAWDSTNQKYELPEAEVIPLGESVNEKKKLKNVTNKYSNLYEHDNIPLPGFTLHKTDRKNWGSVDQTWLVIDPRGFLVRISSKNLESILLVTGITEGLIQEKCVWARDNTETKMTLVPVSEKSYVDAVQNTELIENKVDLKDVQIGDTVFLQNRLQGTYMGIASLYAPLNDYSTDNSYKPQAYLRRQIIEVTPGMYHYQTDLKILKVVKKTDIPMTRLESVEKMNQDISSGTGFFTSSTQMNRTQYGTREMIRLASIHAAPKVLMSFEEITLIDAELLFNQGMMTSDCGMLLLEDLKKDKFLVDYPYIYTGNVSTSTSFDVSRLLPCNLDPKEKLVLSERRRSLWGGSRTISPGAVALDKFTKFYKIVKHVKDQTYN